jgi:hypothetical protein
MYQTHYVPAYTNHVLHFILTFFTFGLWAPVWFLVWVVNHNRTIARQVWVPVAPQPAYDRNRYWPQQNLPAPLPQGWHAQ